MPQHENSKLKMWRLVAIGTLLACLALAGGVSAGANANVNFDANELINQIQTWVRHSKPGERAGFVKGLAEKASFGAPQDYHVMVFNANQEYRNGLLDVIFFTQVHEYDSHFQIWVFKCGTFMNKGERGWGNWAYKGEFVNFNSGNGVIFTSPSCPNPAYRPNLYVEVPNRDYGHGELRTFHDVESVFECYAWSTEIDANMAVYDHQSRRCHAKPTQFVGGSGETFDRHGNKLGNFDIAYNDAKATKNLDERAAWFRDGQCDATHTLRGESWCKKFDHRDGRTLILRRRT